MTDIEAKAREIVMACVGADAQIKLISEALRHYGAERYSAAACASAKCLQEYGDIRAREAHNAAVDAAALKCGASAICWAHDPDKRAHYRKVEADSLAAQIRALKLPEPK